ncbi:hypothetical protein [Glutamicibacter arilaitensis]|uniref:hypothetical protein n=1 Tax=Glutamicibacter arilaitensis TaxID=256701 RepID=UPI003F936541
MRTPDGLMGFPDGPASLHFASRQKQPGEEFGGWLATCPSCVKRKTKPVQTTTKDTGETVIVPATVERDVYGQGYDWIQSLEGSGWYEVPGWGRDGWDLGSWPYIIFAAAVTSDEKGQLFGYCTYVEGDVTARWYRSCEARNLAISKEAFWYWASGQSDGPEALEGMDPQDFRQIDGLCEPYLPDYGK